METGKNWRSMTFGERVRETRKHRKLNQNQVAGVAGIKQPSLSDIENNETKLEDLKAPTFIGLLKALQVKTEFLVSGDGDPDEKRALGREVSLLEEKIVDLVQKLTPEQQAELVDPLSATVQANQVASKNLKGGLRTVGNKQMEDQYGAPGVNRRQEGVTLRHPDRRATTLAGLRVGEKAAAKYKGTKTKPSKKPE